MEQQELVQDTHDRLSALVEAGDYAGAKELLKDRFAQLPEEVRGRLLVILLADAIETESIVLDETLAIQKEGITALKALEELKVAVIA